MRFWANIQLKLHKIWNNTKKPAYFDNFYWIWRHLCNSFNFGWILAQKRTWLRNLRPFWFFWHPWHPWGRLSSGDIWFELEKSSKSQCVLGLKSFFKCYENDIYKKDDLGQKIGKRRYHYFQNWHFYTFDGFLIFFQKALICVGVFRFEIVALREKLGC